MIDPPPMRAEREELFGVRLGTYDAIMDEISAGVRQMAGMLRLGLACEGVMPIAPLDGGDNVIDVRGSFGHGEAIRRQRAAVTVLVRGVLVSWWQNFGARGTSALTSTGSARMLRAGSLTW